jgi:hypothetical protein
MLVRLLGCCQPVGRGVPPPHYILRQQEQLRAGIAFRPEENSRTFFWVFSIAYAISVRQLIPTLQTSSILLAATFGGTGMYNRNTGKALAPDGEPFGGQLDKSLRQGPEKTGPRLDKGGMARDTAPVMLPGRRLYLSGQTRAFTPIWGEKRFCAAKRRANDLAFRAPNARSASAGLRAMPHTQQNRGRTTRPVSPVRKAPDVNDRTRKAGAIVRALVFGSGLVNLT